MVIRDERVMRMTEGRYHNGLLDSIDKGTTSRGKEGSKRRQKV